ncbi:hypothetical protein OJJOAM_003861 [Cupriavidus sp. H18C1]
MRGVARHRVPRIDARHFGALPIADALRDLAGVDGRQQPVQRHVDEGGIADEAVLVAGRLLHRLADHANIVGAVVPQRAQIELLEDRQHLQQHRAAAGRPVGGDAAVAVAANQRRGAHGLVAGQVLPRQQRAVFAHVGDDLFGDLAQIERVDAAGRDPLQRVGIVAVLQRGADRMRRTVGAAIQLPAAFAEGQALAVAGAAQRRLVDPERIHAGAHEVAVARPLDRRLHHLLPRQPAVAAMQRLQAAQRARRGDRLVADVVEAVLDEEAEAVARFAFQQVGPHVGARGRRRGGMEVDVFVRAAAGHIDGGGAEARDAAHQRIDHGLRQGAGDRGIGRIAARAQDLDAGLRRFGLRAGHHSTTGHCLSR